MYCTMQYPWQKSLSIITPEKAVMVVLNCWTCRRKTDAKSMYTSNIREVGCGGPFIKQ